MSSNWLDDQIYVPNIFKKIRNATRIWTRMNCVCLYEYLMYSAIIHKYPLHPSPHQKLQPGPF